eukprot:m.27362 g.27362  ORF g.27362 m.27362 type:complete len:344 (+) comp9010_c0_seq1:147-1178(+)
MREAGDIQCSTASFFFELPFTLLIPPSLPLLSMASHFLTTAGGVIGCYVLYGYVQEFIFVSPLRDLGWYVTFLQFVFYTIISTAEMHYQGHRRSPLPMSSFFLVAFLTVTTMGCSNAALMYLNYPTQIMFKSCKPLPVMLGSMVLQKKRYSLVNIGGAALMCAGLVVFTLANVSVQPAFNVFGVFIICLSLLADAVIGNVQESLMRTGGVTGTEMIFRSYLLGSVLLAFYCAVTGELQSGLYITFTSPFVVTMVPVILFSITGYFGLSLVLVLIKSHGAFIAVTVTNLRKLVTMILSFILFPKPFLFQYVVGGGMVASGLWLAGRKTPSRPVLPTTAKDMQQL